MTDTVVVAGLTARPLAESARRAGWEVIALDLFGDEDTRRASCEWHCIGEPAALAIDPVRLHKALQRAATRRDVIGWIAGSGFEGIADALDLQVPGLPLLGMPAAAVRPVRDPASFFAVLDQLGLDHPEVSLRRPAVPTGWLVKSSWGAGGRHIRRAAQGRTGATMANAPGTYYQRLQPGEPMSALFLADGRHARLVALNRLVVRLLGNCPFVYSGAIGPIRDDALMQQVVQALASLVPALGLRGLASLDFMAHAGRAWLLEVNPRPSASMVLHEAAWSGGLLKAHVRAVQGELPAVPASHPPGVRGCRTLFAEGPCSIGTILAGELARSGHCHDLPAAGTRFAAGEPVCSLSVEAPSAAAVMAALDRTATQLARRLQASEELAA